MPVTRPAAINNPLPTPPGPKNHARSVIAFQRSPLDFVGRLIDTYGDVSSFRLPNARVVVLHHPEHIKHILQRNPDNYDRSAAAHKMAANLFGRGLSMMEGGEPWRRRRHLMQPSFHYQRVGLMSEHMIDVITMVLDRWQRPAEANQLVDAGAEMRRLTLRIVARALFGVHDEATVQRFARAVDIVDEELSAYMRFPLVPLGVPTPGHRRFRENLAVIDDVINHTIAMHLGDDIDRHDLMSMLVQATDADSGERLSHQELRDECFNLLFAGHETSANVLTWICHRLGLHPDVQDRIHEEVDREIGVRPVAFSDTTRLTYTEWVINETMRLYPQQWQGWRHVRDDDEIGGFRIPAGADLFYSPYHTHRRPEIWSDPESFQPERFAPEHGDERSRSAHIPFGAGPHACIGKQFAMSEMLLAVAAIVQRFRVELTSAEPIAPLPLITLGPARPVMIRLAARG